MKTFERLTVVESLYKVACAVPSDINEHVPVLRMLASVCEHVTEMGTRTAVSTTGLLAGRPKKLVCYDLFRSPELDRLMSVSDPTEMVFRQENTLECDMETTDLLFCDTTHTYDQLSAELERHAGKVSRFIALHDTTTFGAAGELPGHVGLWPAVMEYLGEHREWQIAERLQNNNGLTILERVG